MGFECIFGFREQFAIKKSSLLHVVIFIFVIKIPQNWFHLIVYCLGHTHECENDTRKCEKDGHS
jgi:hypothetical protein